MTTLNSILLLVVGVLGVASFAIFATLRWWRYWSGRANFFLWVAIIINAAFFAAQEYGLVGRDGVAESIVLGLLVPAFAFNLGVNIYKKWFWKPEHDVKRDQRRALRIAGRRNA